MVGSSCIGPISYVRAPYSRYMHLKFTNVRSPPRFAEYGFSGSLFQLRAPPNTHPAVAVHSPFIRSSITRSRDTSQSFARSRAAPCAMEPRLPRSSGGSVRHPPTSPEGGKAGCPHLQGRPITAQALFQAPVSRTTRAPSHRPGKSGGGYGAQCWTCCKVFELAAGSGTAQTKVLGGI